MVLAVRGRGHDSGSALRALEPQLGPHDEVIVVDDGEAGEPPPWVSRVTLPGGLVPELWAAGLAAASGVVVALTSAGLVPDRNWLSRARSVASGPEAAVGGAIEPGPDLGLVDWALYFCRYARYMLPLDEAGLEVAADNAAYRAEALAPYRDLWADGFWEPFVHQAMKADGHSLVVRADLLTTFTSGARVADFALQRYRHGRVYGVLRSSGSRSMAAVASLGAPLVPVLMTVRAGREVWAKGRHRGRFVLSLPLVYLFYSFWAAGEVVGRLAAASRRRPAGVAGSACATPPQPREGH